MYVEYYWFHNNCVLLRSMYCYILCIAILLMYCLCTAYYVLLDRMLVAQGKPV